MEDHLSTSFIPQKSFDSMSKLISSMYPEQT